MSARWPCGQTRRSYCRRRDDLVKTYVRLPYTRQQHVIDWAHQHGIPTSSHYLYPSVAFGQDSIEHMGATSRLGYPQQKTSRLNHSYQDFIELLARSGMTLTPTLFNATSTLLGRDPSPLDDTRFLTLFPSWAIASVRAAVARAQGSDPAPAEASLVRNGAAIRAVVRGGGRVINGTDAPIDYVALSYHMNLQAIAQYALTPFEALQTATTVPAELLGAGEDLGTIEAGKLADLVFVGSDPLEDVRAVMDVRRVMQNGVLYELEDLLAPFATGADATPREVQAETPLLASLPAADRTAHAEHWWEDPAFWEGDSCCKSSFA